MTRYCALLLTVLLLSVPATAQPVEPPVVSHELVLDDGTRAFGAIEQETETEVVFRTASGAVLRASRARIASLRPAHGRVVGGEFRPDDPNRTRLLFAPTGRSLRRGQVYLGVYETVIPFVQVGVTDRISIGGGTPLVFGFDESSRLFWVTPKVQVFSSASTHGSVGVFHGMSGSDTAGIAYGVVTREAPQGAFTIGAGVTYSDGRSGNGVVMVGGEFPTRRKVKLITENYLWGSAGLLTGGVRFFGEHLSADLALGIAIGDDGAFGFPIVNFVYQF